VTRQTLERLSYVIALVVVGASIWYWHAQIGSVLEVLEMAYG